jgi:hypothetical protein
MRIFEKNFVFITAVSLLLVWLAALIRPISDFDYWFYLIIGNYVLEHKALPINEFYIFTATSEPGIFSSWGFGLISAMLYKFGATWANIGQAFICSFPFVFHLTANTNKINISLFPLRAVAVSLAVALVFVAYEDRCYYRAEAVLYLFIPFGLLVASKMRTFFFDGRTSYFYALAVLGALLTMALSNFHTTAPLLIYLMSLEMYFGSFQDKPSFGNLSWFKFAMVAALLAALYLLTSALNPYGMAQIKTQVFSNFDNLMNLLRGFLAAPSTPLSDVGKPVAGKVYNLEYISAFQAGLGGRFLFLCFLSIFSFIFSRNKVKAFFWLAPFIFLAYAHSRYVGLAAFMVFFPLAESLLSMFKKMKDRAMGPKLTYIISMALAAAPASYSLASNKISFGEMAGLYPKNSVNYLIKHNELKGNIFTYFTLGAYARAKLGDGWMIPIDGHFTTSSAAYEAYYEALRKPEKAHELFEKFGIKAAILPGTTPWVGSVERLTHALAQSKHWRLKVGEPAGMLWVKVDNPASVEEKYSDMRDYLISLDLEARQTIRISRLTEAQEKSRQTIEFAKDGLMKLEADHR